MSARKVAEKLPRCPHRCEGLFVVFLPAFGVDGQSTGKANTTNRLRNKFLRTLGIVYHNMISFPVEK